MKQFDAYAYGKEQGYFAHDMMECMIAASIAKIFVEKGVKMTKDQVDEFTEGFWNGVV